jgi:excisionase family DNA binding protein
MRRYLFSTSSLVSQAGGRARNGASKTTSVPKLLTIEQVAERLEVSPRTVRRWISAGALAVHRFGRTVRISEPDLTACLAAHRQS